MWTSWRRENRSADVGVHCALIAVDIAGFGDPRRDDAARVRLRDLLDEYEVAWETFGWGNVPRADIVQERRGDGVLMVVPGRFAQPGKIRSLLSVLWDLGMRTDDGAIAEGSRVRLRVALHAGLVYRDSDGLSGDAVDHTLRLLGVAPERSTDETGTKLVLIVSDVVYETAVRYGAGENDPRFFREVTVEVKETHRPAWIHLRDPRLLPIPALGAPIAGPGPADDESSPAGRSPTRFLTAHLPERVPRRAEVSLVVHVRADAYGTTGARSVALRSAAMDVDGTPVTVVVQAPRGLVPLGALQQVIYVPPEGDADPVRFPFRVDDVGPQSVQVTAWAGGTFLAQLSLVVSAEEDTPYVDLLPSFMPRAPLPSTEPNAGEVTLQVRFDGRHYMFQLMSEAYLFEPVVIESLATEPAAAVERTVALLRQLAEGTAPYTGANARRRLVEAGVGLWNDMVPGEIKDQFWALGEHVSAFSIADDRGIIPWELLYPKTMDKDGGFLVERFPVLRRVYGQQRHDGIMLGTPRFVAPAGGPANAEDEIAAIRDLLGDDGHDVIGDLAGLLELIDSGPAGALHFACHNAHDPDGGAAIGMDGGPLVPDLLNSAASVKALKAGHPLVFLNACRTAGVAMQYLRTTGWAQKFMTAGAGAFVGTLWAVRSESATRFARPFYEALRDGEPLGEASRIARTTARGDDGDPSWLAYTIYGNPTARALT